MNSNQESREVNGTLARRYAQAFLSVYGEQIAAHTYERLLLFKQFLVANRGLIYLFTIPSIDQKIKKQGLVFLAEKFELPKSFYSLMELLLLSHRVSLLPQVLCSLVTLYRNEQGIQSFVVHSSHELSGQDLEQLRAFLKAQIVSKQEAYRVNNHDTIEVVCSYKQDKNLIAGIRMQSETYLWEYSIARQLRAIGLSLVR